MGTLTCGGCDATWSGAGRAHCSGCHRTFGGLSMFERHRVASKCVDPAGWDDARLVDGLWVGPAMPARWS